MGCAPLEMVHYGKKVSYILYVFCALWQEVSLYVLMTYESGIFGGLAVYLLQFQ